MEIDDTQVLQMQLFQTEFRCDRQADDRMGFSSAVNSPPTAFAVPEVCAITCKQYTKLHEDNAKLLNKIELNTKHLYKMMKRSNFILVCPIMVH